MATVSMHAIKIYRVPPLTALQASSIRYHIPPKIAYLVLVTTASQTSGLLYLKEIKRLEYMVDN